MNKEPVFNRAYTDYHPRIKKAKGVYCYDVNNKRYIDASSGVCVVSIGHGQTSVLNAIKKQFRKVCFAHPFHWKSNPQEELASEILSLMSKDYGKVYFVSGGSEATETALKLALQYWRHKGEEDKHLVISRWTSYHGATMGALSMSGWKVRREPFEKDLLDFPHINLCYSYRNHHGSKRLCNAECAEELEKAIIKANPKNVAAFIMEPIIGNAGGAIEPVPGYVEGISRICKKYNVLLIFDEVITAYGRTGSPFAFQHYGVKPDIICTAKSLGGGYVPLGAVIMKSEIGRVFEENVFSHGFTYGGNPLSCAIGLSVLKYMKKKKLFERAQDVGSYMFMKAREELASNKIVGDIRGKGMLMGIEFVKNKETKEPFPAEEKIAYEIAGLAFRHGILTMPGNGGLIDGKGDFLVIAPPLTTKKKIIDEIIDILKQAIEEFVTTYEAKK